MNSTQRDVKLLATMLELIESPEIRRRIEKVLLGKDADAPPVRVMTAAAAGNRWAIAFMMPTNCTLETLPEPTDEKVRLRAIQARRMAAVQYSGTWSKQRYERNLVRLREWMKAQGLAAAGDPVWARYDVPFMPWFLRRNEVLAPLPSR